MYKAPHFWAPFFIFPVSSVDWHLRALITCIVFTWKFLKYLKIDQGIENPANSAYWFLIICFEYSVVLNNRKPADNLQYLFHPIIPIQDCSDHLNLLIAVLFNWNYHLIELNNEFWIDLFHFFGFKKFNNAVIFSSSSSQTGWVIFLLAEVIYFSNIFFLITCK